MIVMRDHVTASMLLIITLDMIDGKLAVTASVSSHDGRTIASLKKNEWSVNTNNEKKSIKDISTLEMYDQYDTRAL
jgi:hypothetical protein